MRHSLAQLDGLIDLLVEQLVREIEQANVEAPRPPFAEATAEAQQRMERERDYHDSSAAR